ncbi:hypothetical protein KP509_29G078800 [Ceratopteris richardii]|uniref:Uncharacterized protein n=1 Tax=Ceratopteris richardii TaxID=49495 RepID=A0A8T2RA52_CERRI|nr:hypothetical protein KP509_29G078800 [Ceratopteris richardii]
MEVHADATLKDPSCGSPRFVPKHPPRRRQKAVLPRLGDHEQRHPPHEARPSVNPGAGYALPYDSEIIMRNRMQATYPKMETQEFAPQEYPVEPRGSYSKKQKHRHSEGNFISGATHFSSSWNRFPEEIQYQQRGFMPPSTAFVDYPRNGGYIFPFQHQKDRTTCAPPNNGVSHPAELLSHPASTFPKDFKALYPLLETKASFEKMWHELDAAIQRREGMFANLKADMERASSLVKNAKADAVNERKAATARNAEAINNLDHITKQTGKIKSIREVLEQISTDLSVQVAELNLMLQQVQQQQRVVEVLESLGTHKDDSRNDKAKFIDESLQDCELKLTFMEKELDGSKRTSELLEESALKNMNYLEEIEANCKSNRLISREVQTVRGAGEMSGGSKIESKADLKVPKLEPVT